MNSHNLLEAVSKIGLPDGPEKPDEMIWLYLNGYDISSPPPVAMKLFAKALLYNDPETRISRDLTAAQRWLASKYPVSSIDFRCKNGEITTEVVIQENGPNVTGHFLDDAFGTGRPEVALAYACLEAHAVAEKNKRDALEVSGILARVSPLNEWPIGKYLDRYHRVNHKEKLIGNGHRSREQAHRIAEPMSSVWDILRKRRRYQIVVVERRDYREWQE